MDTISKETIVIVGYGWVGQANSLALSNAGYGVSYFDIVKQELHYKNTHGVLYDKISALRSVLELDGENTWYIVCVGDQVSLEGEQDISSIKKALDSLKKAKGGVVLRSTVLPGHLSSLKFDYYIPEFLHEKLAVEECMRPHYFIVGSRDSKRQSPSFFNTWQQHAIKIFHGTPEEASHIKYLSNIWNALRVAFVNEFGSTITLPIDQEKLSQVEKIINFFFEEKSYLRYGKSFGGHCLPKDMHAYCAWYMNQGSEMSLLRGVWKANDTQQVIEKKYLILPNWFSKWDRPQISGQVALRALGASIKRKLSNFLG